MKLYVIRHGQTDWNVKEKCQGRTDIELNNTGIKQAQNAKEQLKKYKIDLIICSPLKRTRKTAEIINENKQVETIIDDRIRERELGEFEGHDITEEIENKIWDYNLNYKISGGESLYDFEKRILDFFKDIKQKYSDKNVLIVAHGGIAKVIKAYIYGMPESKNLSEIKMKNCEIIETEI